MAKHTAKPIIIIILFFFSNLLPAAGWPYRRNVPNLNLNLPQQTVVLEFSMPAGANGFQLKTDKGESRDTGVMQHHGSRYQVYFNARKGEKFQLLFSKHKNDLKKVACATGLLREVRQYKGGNVQNLKDFKKFWQTAKIKGREFVPNVFSGCNPFSPDANSLHRYEGTITIPKEDNYTFYLASTDASFLLIDGKQVVSWPGRHGPWQGQYGKISGTIHLAKGDHRFLYLHANQGNSCIAAAAFSTPGNKHYRIIPANSFTQPVWTSAGRLLDADNRPVVDFSWNLLENTSFDQTTMDKISFQAAYPPPGKNFSFSWDFGDGTKGTGTLVNHIYFRQKKYMVTLTILQQGKPSATMSQVVLPHYNRKRYLFDNNKTRLLIDEAIKQAQTAGVQKEGYQTIVSACLHYRDEQRAEHFLPTVLANLKYVKPDLFIPSFNELCLPILLEKEDFARIDAVYPLMLRHYGKDREVRNRLLLDYADFLVWHMDNVGKARKILAGISKTGYARELEPRVLAIQADIAFAENKRDEADELIAKLKKLQPDLTNPKNQLAQLHLDSLLLSANNYVVLKMYDEALVKLRELEEKKPDSRIDPGFLFLKGVVFQHKNMPLSAKICFKKALSGNLGDSEFKSKLRLHLAEMLIKENQPQKAKQQLEVICQENPDSIYEIKAKKMLVKLNKNRSQP